MEHYQFTPEEIKRMADGQTSRLTNAEVDALHARVAEMEAKKDAAYREERRHVCALLSLLVYDSDGEPMNQGSILGLCNDVEAEYFKPKG